MYAYIYIYIYTYIYTESLSNLLFISSPIKHNHEAPLYMAGFYFVYDHGKHRNAKR